MSVIFYLSGYIGTNAKRPYTSLEMPNFCIFYISSIACKSILILIKSLIIRDFKQ